MNSKAIQIPQEKRLRILFINSIQMWGGGEVWLMDVMHGLQARGHTVSLICRPETILEKNATAAGFDVIPMAMHSDFDPVVIAKVWRVLRRKRIQVISTNMDKELRFGGVAAKLAGGVAVIPSREVDYPLKNRLRYRFTYNFLADHILANSNSTKNTLLRHAPWLAPDRVEVIYKGIDPRPYLNEPEQGTRLRQELDIPQDAPLVGFVGQIIERKGIHDLVKCAPLVVRELPKVKFLIVGEGALRDFLVKSFHQANLSDHLVYAGFRQDVPAVMKAIDLLILPSIVEGFGYVLVEAMAAGKPVVATNVSSIPEIVRNEETGLLVEVHAPEQLAAAIAGILRNRKLQRSFGERGRQVVLEHFTLARMLDHLETALVSQTARKRGALKTPALDQPPAGSNR